MTKKPTQNDYPKIRSFNDLEPFIFDLNEGNRRINDKLLTILYKLGITKFTKDKIESAVKNERKRIIKLIDKWLDLISESHKQDFRGDAKYENRCWQALKRIHCMFHCADNYDYESTKDGVKKILLELKKEIEK